MTRYFAVRKKGNPALFSSPTGWTTLDLADKFSFRLAGPVLQENIADFRQRLEACGAGELVEITFTPVKSN